MAENIAGYSISFNSDIAIGFLVFGGSDAITRKLSIFVILAKHLYGEIEKCNEVADFGAILALNRSSIVSSRVKSIWCRILGEKKIG